MDDVVLVSTDEICAAIQDIFENTRAIAEPAGALALAGLRKYVETHGTTDQVMIAINSGANVNFDRLQHIAERAVIGERLEALFAVTIPEVAGSFLAFCQTLGKRSVTEFNYRYSDQNRAVVFVGLRLQNGQEEQADIALMLRGKGYDVSDLTDNEVAKMHVRHMVGGPNANILNERIFRFEFPERPGALLQFLTQMGGKWNISLFHYRNHGSAFGRVLVGIQVAESEMAAFDEFLHALNYGVIDESDNVACRLFL